MVQAMTTAKAQLDLFDAPPHNGTTTSRAAAESVAKSGRAAEDRRRILRLLSMDQAKPFWDAGYTREELEIELDIESGSVCPRVNELVKAGFVEERGTRKTTKGKSAKIVHITEAGREALRQKGEG